MAYGMECSYSERVMSFLSEIGLAVAVEKGASGFIDGVELIEGGLRVDPKASPSCLLHEAGHLAVVPAQFRHYLNGNIANGLIRAFEEIEARGLPGDDPLYRKMLQAGDTEATAWAWAVGKALDIPEELIIRDEDYDETGESIRLGLSHNAYIGINGIANADFCSARRSHRGLPVYPTLAFWLQH